MMPHEKPMDISLWYDGQDVSGPLTLAFEMALALGNLLPICVICIKRGRTRIATDELIIALSITDILSVVIPGPLGWISYFTHQWYGGIHTCQFYQVCITWFQLTSMCLITFMTFDRWMSLRDALTYKAPSSYNNCRIRLSVFLIYIFTLLVSCLPLIGLAPKGMSASGQLCQSWLLATPHSTLEHVFHFVFLTVGYSNLLTTVLVNMTVMATLWRFQKKFGAKQAERMSSATLQIDRRSVVELTVMTLIVTLIFYLAWMPTLILLTLLQFGTAMSDRTVLYALLSTTLTGLLNPIIYGVFSRSYRRGYYKLIISASKFIFGCPLTQEDVLKGIPNQGHTLRTARNNGNSSTALLPSSSIDGADSDVAAHVQDAFPIAHTLGSAIARYELLTQQIRSPVVGFSRDHVTEADHPEDLYGYDLQERSYMDELLEKEDPDAAKELYGSRLSLVSEESDDHGYSGLDESNRRCVPIIIQESMI